MITLTTVGGVEFDIQPSAIILAREPISTDPEGTGAVVLYKRPADAPPGKEVHVQEDIYDIAEEDETLFVTEDRTPDNEVLVLLRNQTRVVGVIDNDADPVQYEYNDERFERTIRTHNGDYDSFMAQFDGSYSPPSESSPSSPSSPSSSSLSD